MDTASDRNVNECPWCHGTQTQFCENQECRPTQPEQPPEELDCNGGACRGACFSALFWVIGIFGYLIGSMIVREL